MADRIPEGWRECKLGEIAELVKEKYTPRKGNELNYIGLEHIQEQALRLNGIGHSDDVKSDKFYFKKGDILFGKLRPYFRKVVCPNFDGVCSTDVWVIRSKGGVIQDYLFYLFANKELVDLSNSGESGTRMPRADWNFMRQTVWRVPKCESEQRAIASVLGSLDDKIDLLNRENKTLEQMAETLFRQWFVEEADEGWEEGKLGDVIEIFDHSRIPLSRIERDKKKEGQLYPYYGAAKIMDYINEYIFDGEFILIAEDGTVRTNDGFPILQYANGKFWVNNHTHVIKAKSPYSNFFLWNYLIEKNIDEIITGAVQPKINQENLRKLEFPVFPESLVKEFNIITEPLFNKIKQNQSQIRTLEKLRDTLLPKLMSGEVRVKFTDSEV
ncbi:MAG: restriction endonuclease subunit S [Syntrophaceae bacterium]